MEILLFAAVAAVWLFGPILLLSAVVAMLTPKDD